MDDKGKGGQYRRFKEPNFYDLSDYNNTSELLLDMSWIAPSMAYANVDDEKIMISSDGRYFVYVVEQGGSDYLRIRTWDIKNNKSMEQDEIKGVKFSHPSIVDDCTGFVYSRYATPGSHNYSGHDTEKLHYNTLYFHKFGTLQKDDIILYQNLRYPYHSIHAKLFERDYIFIDIDEGKKNIHGVIK